MTFGVTQTTAARAHVVLAPGGYNENVSIPQGATPAPAVYIHGGGATVSSLPGDTPITLSTYHPSVISDLTLSSTGTALVAGGTGTHTFERVVLDASAVGARIGNTVTLRDFIVESAHYAVVMNSGGHLTLDRGVIRGTTNGVSDNDTGNTIAISNVLIHNVTNLALDVSMASGTIQFTTIADSGTGTSAGPRAVRCSNAVAIRSSIIWAPGTADRPPIAGCNLSMTIAGPASVAGATNADPQFVDPANRDYHLKATSPARDISPSGPALDFERTPRPSGAAFDLGADEIN